MRTAPSSLALRSPGKIKQRRAASPSKDGAPDKDLSMVHFSRTEGGGAERDQAGLGMGAGEGSKKNCPWTNGIQIKHVPP